MCKRNIRVFDYVFKFNCCWIVFIDLPLLNISVFPTWFANKYFPASFDFCLSERNEKSKTKNSESEWLLMRCERNSRIFLYFVIKEIFLLLKWKYFKCLKTVTYDEDEWSSPIGRVCYLRCTYKDQNHSTPLVEWPIS